jgi:hypothetical protein
MSYYSTWKDYSQVGKIHLEQLDVKLTYFSMNFFQTTIQKEYYVTIFHLI